MLVPGRSSERAHGLAVCLSERAACSVMWPMRLAECDGWGILVGWNGREKESSPCVREERERVFVVQVCQSGQKGLQSNGFDLQYSFYSHHLKVIIDKLLFCRYIDLYHDSIPQCLLSKKKLVAF